MTVSREVLMKVRRLKKIEAERKRIYGELFDEFGADFDGCFIEDYDVADEPHGEDQGDGEYCDQWTEYCEDSGSGVYYYPVEGSRKYIAISYGF